MGSEGRRENDLVLDPTQFAYVLDETNGQLDCYVGPTKTSLSATDSPRTFDGAQFLRSKTVEQAVCLFPVAREGDYIDLQNPAEDQPHPTKGKNGSAKLRVGRKVNVSGPASFPLWPGQVARVIPGHHLRSNQYLVACVYNDEEARENWSQMVARPQEPGRSKEEGEQRSEQPTANAVRAQAGELSVGKQMVIKGTDVSFFIPPTGIEVLADKANEFVREAVTLERLEYCILVDEDGNKRYERGPQVVFPCPTERFVEHTADEQTTRRFRAIELNEISGIYVKVIAPYSEKGPASQSPGTDVGMLEFQEGEELFITGREQKIYFPRPEHAIITYGEQDRIFAVAIPEGEARYVLDRLSGSVHLERGPKMFLADPRYEVIVRRVLDPRTVGLWFPGNQQAAKYNAGLAALSQGSQSMVDDASYREQLASALISNVGPRTFTRGASYSALMSSGAPAEAGGFHAGDEIKRKRSFSPPRTLVLDTKYDGAVVIDVWTGYAVQVISRSGKREIVVGPQTRILGYDETLERMELSTGKPKNTEDLLPTVYLRVANNKIGDIISAETSDFVQVKVKVSYRVDFDLEYQDKWFAVENYVKFLCDHCRSMIRNRAKSTTVRNFIADYVNEIRDTILGQKRPITDEAVLPTGSTWPGLLFRENGMRIQDVEVLGVEIGDARIADVLKDTQRNIVQREMKLTQEEQQLGLEERSQEIRRAISHAVNETQLAQLHLEAETAAASAINRMQALEAGERQLTKEHELEDMRRTDADKQHEVELARIRADNAHELEVVKSETETKIHSLRERGRVLADGLKAVTPDLIAAMQVHGDKLVTAEVVKELGAVAALTGDSIEGVFKRILHGTAISEMFTGDHTLAGQGFGLTVSKRTRERVQEQSE